MSKNGNKIAVVAAASRIGFAVMTVTAAAILTASTLLAEPFDQTSPVALISALHKRLWLPSRFPQKPRQGHLRHGEFSSSLPETTSYFALGALLRCDNSRCCTFLARRWQPRCP